MLCSPFSPLRSTTVRVIACFPAERIASAVTFPWSSMPSTSGSPMSPSIDETQRTVWMSLRPFSSATVPTNFTISFSRTTALSWGETMTPVGAMFLVLSRVISLPPHEKRNDEPRRSRTGRIGVLTTTTIVAPLPAIVPPSAISPLLQRNYLGGGGGFLLMGFSRTSGMGSGIGGGGLQVTRSTRQPAGVQIAVAPSSTPQLG
jgi:hypothetical protein